MYHEIHPFTCRCRYILIKGQYYNNNMTLLLELLVFYLLIMFSLKISKVFWGLLTVFYLFSQENDDRGNNCALIMLKTFIFCYFPWILVVSYMQIMYGVSRFWQIYTVQYYIYVQRERESEYYCLDAIKYLGLKYLMHSYC